MSVDRAANLGEAFGRAIVEEKADIDEVIAASSGVLGCYLCLLEPDRAKAMLEVIVKALRDTCPDPERVRH